MAKDNGDDNSGNDGIANNLSTPSTSLAAGIKRTAHRSKPYDANNSFVKKVATKMTDLLPQKSWISKWFNNSQDETNLKSTETDKPDYGAYEDKESLKPPPLKRPCIRLDVTHPPGTFTIKPRSRNISNEDKSSKEHFANHNETTQDFLEPSNAITGPRLHRFVSSTPAYPTNTAKVAETRSALNILMSEQNNNSATNGMDDNSESSESTSGCSSLIPQNNRQEAQSNSNYNSPFMNKKRFIDEKFSFTSHLQSPRTLFLDNSNRETLSSRRPSFDPLMMSNTLTRSSSLSSPFYSGNTVFGGANAASLYRSNSVLSEPPQLPKRTSVEVNPSSESSKPDLSSMSQTARRILETLEQFSSPLTDAKKMPVRNIMGGSSSSSPTFNRKRAREEDSPRVGLRHLTRELTVPTVPDILRIRRRQKLQNTTVNARKIMTARNASASIATQDYHIRAEDDEELKRNTQLKAKKKMNLEEEDTVEAVNLPTIPLPISNLPRFDISLPQCTKPVIHEKQKHTKMSEKNDSFKFASPIKLTEEAKNLESINDFTFSKPISPSKINSSFPINDSQELSKTLSIDSNETFSFSSTTSFPNFVWTGPSQTLKPKEKKQSKTEESTGLKVASELKSGSIMDFFAKKTSNSSDLSDVWECNECLIKNNSTEKYCVACKSPKPDNSDGIEILESPSDNKDSKINTQPRDNTVKTNLKTFGSSTYTSIFGKLNATSQSQSTKTSIFNTSFTSATSEKTKTDDDDSTSMTNETSTKTMPTSVSTLISTFKPAKSSWECPCCMVRNVETVTICPCCNTAKPGSVNVSPKRTTSSAAPIATVTSGFGDKFKKPEGSWSCDTCMVQNKADENKCVACEMPRTGVTTSTTTSNGFGDKFKKPEGSWTCDSCMLSNKAEATKCIACETAKSNGESNKPSSKLQFNVDMPANASTFKFGIDKAEDTVESAVASLPKANDFTFGSGATSQIATAGFSFGVPNANKTKSDNDAPKSTGFTFKPSETITATATFQFGSKPTEAKEKEEKKKPAAAFSFGAPATSDSKPTNVNFAFGAPMKADTDANTTENKTEETKESTKIATVGFAFGAPTSMLTKTNNDSPVETSISSHMKDTETSNTLTAPSNLPFNSPKPTTNVKPEDNSKKENDTKPSLIPTFNVPAEQPKPAMSNFIFGTAAQSSTSNPPASTSSPFVFSRQQSKPAEQQSQNVTPLPAFGSSTAPKPTFSFGKSAETASTVAPAAPQQTENKTQALTFGNQTNTPAFGGQTNQTTPSLFGNVSATVSPASNLGDNKPIIFGGSENKIAPNFGATTDNKTVSTFGTTAKTVTNTFPSAATSSPAALPFGSTPSAFGSSTPSTFNANTTPSIFSTTKSSETPSTTPSLFSFGQSSQPAAPATGGFNFSAGSNASNTIDQKSGIFTFGASSGAPIGNGFGSSSFGAITPAASTSTPAPSFAFNAPPKPEATPTGGFGSVAAPSTTPLFTAPTTPAQPATGGFNFGSTNVPSTFNFGSSSTSTSGGFNFNAPSNPPAPVAFDRNAQPAYNFTVGTTTTAFNAPPRKIKKAVRRMPRQ